MSVSRNAWLLQEVPVDAGLRFVAVVEDQPVGEGELRLREPRSACTAVLHQPLESL
jgi:hypothetical protein